MYADIDRLSEALSHHEKALQLRPETLHSNHPDLVDSYLEIGHLFHRMTAHPRAPSSLEEALRIQETISPLNDPFDL